MEHAPPQPEPPPAAPGVAPRGWHTRLRDWFGRLPGLVKWAVGAFPVLVMILLGSTAIWRDQTQRQVSVTVSPQTDQALLAAGLDLDLRQALIDALNARVQGVEAIAATRGLVQAVNADPQGAISFKPFGSALSTDQVTAITRAILGSRRPTSVRLDLLCGGQECIDGRGLGNGARLVVSMTTPAGDTRTSFALPPGGGLSHGVDTAIGRTADTVLERTEPLLASIYDINAVSSALFADEVRSDIDTADGLAVGLRGARPAVACIADIVTAAARLAGGQVMDGMAALKLAAGLRGNACRLRAASQTVLLLAVVSGCAGDPALRSGAFSALSTLVGRMPAIAADAPRSMADRVPGSRMTLAAAQLLRDADEGTRVAICGKTDNAASGSSAALARDVTSLLETMRRIMPPNTAPSFARQVLDFLALVSTYGVHGDDLISRYGILHGMQALVGDYALAAREPRHLLMLQGALAIEAVRLARDALALSPADKRRDLAAIGLHPGDDASLDGVLLGSVVDNLGTARSAFAAAAVARTATRLEEPSPDIAALVGLGDARTLGGDAEGAARAYAGGMDAFVADGEPIDQLGYLSEAVSHWAVLRIAGGACDAGAAPDEAWEARWSKLGGGAHDACSLRTAPASRSMRTFMDIVRPLAGDVVGHCGLDAEGGSQDPRTGFAARAALADCERHHGTGDPATLLAFSRIDSAAMDVAVGRALGAAP